MSLKYLFDICHVNCPSKKGEHVHVDSEEVADTKEVADIHAGLRGIHVVSG